MSTTQDWRDVIGLHARLQREQAKRSLIQRMRQKALELGLSFDHPRTQKHLLDFADYYREFVALAKADSDTRSFKEIEGQCTPYGSTQTR